MAPRKAIAGYRPVDTGAVAGVSAGVVAAGFGGL